MCHSKLTQYARVCANIGRMLDNECTVGPPNKGHFVDGKNSADLFFVEFFLFGRFEMYCRNFPGTASHVLCREVYYSLIWESPLWEVRL